ncbi:hypothetical protein LADH09A_003443 [Micromonospora sp. LAH09]|uniref:hypothetical protein n=1 Tax=Micromonospora cabrerizensis TaxID=2911213 RepID=UPI001EE875CF|nr:hypothetical protein [Micromonospora cabrerizensis]MCG5469528.1 hypothetical protein [Micromonospora cabrerizensis]
MDDELTAALARVRDAFARYPRRAVLDGCPHCKGSVVVDEHDLFSLTISLGNTVGDRADVKSLLPVLLERLLVSEDLYPAIVLGKASYEEWRTWPRAEQKPSVLGDWLRRDTVRDRLHRAFERDHDTPWADDLARAHDLLRA